MEVFFVDARTWLVAGAILAAGIVVMLAAYSLIVLLAKRLARRRESGLLFSFVNSIRGPARLFFAMAGMMIAVPFTTLPKDVVAGVGHFLQLVLIAGIGWTFVEITHFLSSVVDHRFSIEAADNLAARRVRTQTQVIERVVSALIGIVTVAVMLMTFPGVRQIGASVLASAGIAGLVIGMAAKSTFSSLIAGLQVALTQPIRLEDAVIVENEWGWIEEIRTTYVVVRLWDLRRLIVPLSYFIEHPFQNWTRASSDLIGAVTLYTDYSVPVEEIRRELHRVLEASDLWDKKTWVLQVTDLTDTTMQLRALMSASNSGKAWDLRCLVREKLVDFLKARFPGCLPPRKERMDISGEWKGSNKPAPA